MDVFYFGNMYDTSGYTQVNRYIVSNLCAMGARVFLPAPGPRDGAEWIRKPHLELIDRLVTSRIADTGVAVFGTTAPTFWRYVQEYLQGKGFYKIGMTMIESDRITPGWARACELVNELWVPSSWSKAAFVAGGVPNHKIRIMPLGVDTWLFKPPAARRRSHVYRFLSAFEWIHRKGPDLLVRAYFRAFKRSDPVLLTIKTYPSCLGHTDRDGSRLREQIEGFRRETGRHDLPALEIIQRPVRANQMLALYWSSDCYVLPTRGEGWSLTVMEAMACGLPVITTRWGAHMDYLSDKTAFLIPIDGLEPATDRQEVYGGSHWARPNVDALARLLRYCYENREKARNVGEMARRVVLNYSWKTSVERMYSRLKEVFGEVREGSR